MTMTSPTPPTHPTTELRDDFNTVVAETEQLLKTIATIGSGRTDVLKADVDRALASAAASFADIRQRSFAQASAAAKATDEYVHRDPWRAMGLVACAAAIAGLVAGVFIARR